MSDEDLQLIENILDVDTTEEFIGKGDAAIRILIAEVRRLRELCRRAKVALQPVWGDPCPGCGQTDGQDGAVTHLQNCLYVALNRVSYADEQGESRWDARY